MGREATQSAVCSLGAVKGVFIKNHKSNKEATYSQGVRTVTIVR